MINWTIAAIDIAVELNLFSTSPESASMVIETFLILLCILWVDDDEDDPSQERSNPAHHDGLAAVHVLLHYIFRTHSSDRAKSDPCVLLQTSPLCKSKILVACLLTECPDGFILVILADYKSLALDLDASEPIDSLLG